MFLTLKRGKKMATRKRKTLAEREAAAKATIQKVEALRTLEKAQEQVSKANAQLRKTRG
jgi:hypothetical protein